MGTVVYFETDEPLVALTFDDGPNPEYTPRLLDLLKKFQAHATFFMVGQAAQKHPDLVQRVAQAGHAIANHSWSHPAFVEISSVERREQLRAGHRALAPYGTRLFRPPWGSQNRSSRLDTMVAGFEVIAWSLEVGDWWDADSERMADGLAKGVRPGSIVLLHDALFHPPSPEENPLPRTERDSMLAALKIFFASAGQGYRFVTIPDMFRLARPVRLNWYYPPLTQW
jgi:peptidoglycan-N-acetylglucosamine deacetylase